MAVALALPRLAAAGGEGLSVTFAVSCSTALARYMAFCLNGMGEDNGV